MKINKSKLIELLVDKTGMDQPSVEDQLEQLIKRIIDAAERGKALEIKEFGLFYFDSDGDLKFDPAEEFSTEINFKYAGMEPVEIKSARDSAPVDEETEEPKPEKPADKEKAEEPDESSVQSEEEDVDVDDIFGLDEEISSKRTDPENDFDEYEEPPSDTPVFSKPEKVDRESDPFSGLLGDASSKIDKKPEELPDEDIDSPFDADEELTEEAPNESKAETKEQSEPKVPVSKSVDSTGKPQTSKDPITVVMSVVLVFVLVAAGFFIIPLLFQESDEPQVEQTIDEPVATDITETLTPVEPEDEVVVTEEVEGDIEPEIEMEMELEQPVYGLTGPLVDAANDGFSIVLFSFTNEANARNQAAELAENNYRVLVNSRVVNENTVWRVSVGQFSTIAEAQNSAADLPSPYNSNNFIQRIQTN